MPILRMVLDKMAILRFTLQTICQNVGRPLMHNEWVHYSFLPIWNTLSKICTRRPSGIGNNIMCQVSNESILFTLDEPNKQISAFSVTPTTKYGVHGYDNAEELMHAIFMAKGPLFASGQQIEPFHTVDLFNLFCRVLRIDCKQNEGTDRTSTWNVLLRTPIEPAHPHGAGRIPGKLQQFVSKLYHRIQSYVVARD